MATQHGMRFALVAIQLAAAAGWAAPTPRRAAPTPRHRGRPAAMNIDVLGVLDTFYRTSPYEAAFVTCGFKAAMSDTIAQKAEKASRGFSFARNAAFILYGGFYQGCFQYKMFNEIFPVIFGSSTDFMTVALKVVVDQLLLTPFLCLPCAYVVKALVFNYPVREGLERYLSDAKRDLLWKYWAIWTPAQFLTFGVVPDHLRIVFIAMVSFFWLIILSSISSRDDATRRRSKELVSSSRK